MAPHARSHREHGTVHGKDDLCHVTFLDCVQPKRMQLHKPQHKTASVVVCASACDRQKDGQEDRTTPMPPLC